MARGVTSIGAAVLLLAAAFALVESQAPAARAQAPRSDPEVVTVAMRDDVFVPKQLAVATGTVVRWENDGRNVHNVRPDRGRAFASRDLTRGQSYSATFDEPGTYAYYCSLHGAPGKGMSGTIVVGDAAGAGGEEAAAVGGGSAPAPTIRASGRVIDVPRDAPTIQAGVDRASPGDLVLIAPGVYREAVVVATDGVVLRGVDRNRTILDGGFRRDNGVKVVGADGVAIENLTTRNYRFNGIYWTGALGYRASYVTAYRNGDYGIFAFDSQWGTIEHSYASGSPDSGFYIGQCNPCHAVIDDVVAEHNQLGYSGTNSSGDLHIVQSVWRDNRAGIVPNSLDSEDLAPQGDAVIAANRIERSGAPTSRAASGDEGFDVVYGGGIVIIGGSDNLVQGNVVEDSNRIGIAIAPNPGLIGDGGYPATGNQVVGNVVTGSRVADLAVVLPGADDDNCFSANTAAITAPTDLQVLVPCGAAATGDPSSAPGGLDVGQFLDTSDNPKGVPYRRTPVPPKQSTMTNARRANAVTARAPSVPALGSLQVPQ
jgi:plastocyanin